jgi:hypothetical protein
VIFITKARFWADFQPLQRFVGKFRVPQFLLGKRIASANGGLLHSAQRFAAANVMRAWHPHNRCSRAISQK